MADAQPPAAAPAQGQTQFKPELPKEDFVVKWGFIISILSLALWLLVKDEKTGLPFLDRDKVVIINAALIGWFVLTKFVKIYFDEKQRKVQYKPWNPDVEIINICSNFLRNHNRRLVEILRWQTEPEFGRISADLPHSIHMWVVEMDNRGVRYTSTITLSLLWRNVIKYEFNHIHRESGSHSWSNARKGQEPAFSPYIPSATKVVAVPIQNPTTEPQNSEEAPENDEDDE